MSDSQHENTGRDRLATLRHRSPRARLRLIAWLVLAAGLAGAALIYGCAEPVAGQDVASTIGGSRAEEYGLERLGGKATVYAARLSRWLGGLWHGRPLAGVVAVLTVIVVLGLFWWADGLLDA